MSELGINKPRCYGTVMNCNLIFFNFAHLRHVIYKKYEADVILYSHKNVSPIHTLVHEAKVSNSQYLIKEFKEFIGNQNTPCGFCVLRDRPQVLYIFGKLVNSAVHGLG